jgi:hypothetical protein
MKKPERKMREKKMRRGRIASDNETTILPSPASGRGAGGEGGRRGWLAWLAVAGAIVLLAGNYPHLSTTAQGDVRESPRPEAFLSGGARSEIVLKEISETLKRIDARLERFEKALRDEDASRQAGVQATPGGAAVEQRAPADAANGLDVPPR